MSLSNLIEKDGTLKEVKKGNESKTICQFFDTNVLINNPKVIKELNNKGYNIYLNKLILEELDKLKTNDTNNTGYLQRKQFQYLFSNKEDVTFINDNMEGFIKNFGEFKSPDNIIINTILNFKKDNPDKEIFLYSNDIQVILKQKIFNIPTFSDIKKIDISNILNPYFVIDDKMLSEENLEILVQSLYEKEIIKIPKDIKNEISKFIKQNKVYGYIDFQGNKIQVKLNKKRFTIEIVDKKELHKVLSINNNNNDMREIFPKNDEQQFLLDSIINNNLTVSLSSSGTGKTLLQLYQQIQLLEESNNNEIYKKLEKHYNSIVIIVNPTQLNKHKDIGFLPGSKHEKILPYMRGIIDNLNYLFKDDLPDEFDIENNEKTQNIEVIPLNYIRGQSINNKIIIVDEIQNFTSHELKTLMTRIQDNSKLILTGDLNQVDENISIDYLGIVKIIDFLFKNKDISKLNNFWSLVLLQESLRGQLSQVFNEFSKII